MTVGERIQDLRKKKGFSQEKLAEYLNMSRQAVAKWEQNVCEPNLECLAEMSDLFGVDLDYLIRGKASEEVKSGNNLREKETIIIKEKDNLLDKKDIMPANGLTKPLAGIISCPNSEMHFRRYFLK